MSLLWATLGQLGPVGDADRLARALGFERQSGSPLLRGLWTGTWRGIPAVLRASSEGTPGFGLRLDLNSPPGVPAFVLGSTSDGRQALVAKLAPEALASRIAGETSLAVSEEGLRLACAHVPSVEEVEGHLDHLLSYVRELRDHALVELLRRRLATTPCGDTRAALVEAALRELDVDELSSLRTQLESDPSPDVRLVLRLAQGSARRRLRLLRTVGRRSETTADARRRAAGSVVEMGALTAEPQLLPRTMAVLRLFLTLPDPEARARAQYGLRSMLPLGPRLLPYLIRFAETPAARPVAVEMLGALSLEASEQWLIRALQTSALEQSARDIVRALSTHGSRRAIPALADLLRSLEVGSELSELVLEALRRLQSLPSPGERGGLSLAAETGQLSES